MSNLICFNRLIFYYFKEHGGSHGHSHGLSNTHTKLTHLGNSTDDNENNSFMYENQVRTIKSVISQKKINKMIYFYCRKNQPLKRQLLRHMDTAMVHHK